MLLYIVFYRVNTITNTLINKETVNNYLKKLSRLMLRKSPIFKKDYNAFNLCVI